MNRSLEPSAMRGALEQGDMFLLNLGAQVEGS
jgi:hypothetical protein